MTQDERRKRDESRLVHEVERFLTALYRDEPKLDDGEEHCLIVTGAVVGRDHDGSLVYGFAVRHEVERAL
jgi:hypothetical protein